MTLGEVILRARRHQYMPCYRYNLRRKEGRRIHTPEQDIRNFTLGYPDKFVGIYCTNEQAPLLLEALPYSWDLFETATNLPEYYETVICVPYFLSRHLTALVEQILQIEELPECIGRVWLERRQGTHIYQQETIIDPEVGYIGTVITKQIALPLVPRRHH